MLARAELDPFRPREERQTARDLGSHNIIIAFYPCSPFLMLCITIAAPRSSDCTCRGDNPTSSDGQGLLIMLDNR